MKGKDFLSVGDLTGDEICQLLADALDMKARGRFSMLSGKTLALLFEKPSLRTRISFELAMRELGGEAIYISPAEVGLGKRESVPDVARVLSRYVDAIAARTFSHETLRTLAGYARVPVINALSDLEHPCQALADLLTIYDRRGHLKGLTLAYVGDGNNVARSLLLAAALTGINFRIASPPGYCIQESVLGEAREYAARSGAEITCFQDMQQAVKEADVVYTDVWTSMGQESEAEVRRKVFAPYQVTAELLSQASEDAIFMHPLPAHHGEEVAEGLIDDPRSVVFDQAENRKHLQKALLGEMMGGLGIALPGYR